MTVTIQGSLRVCEALAALRNIWSRWTEWRDNRDYYCKVRLPQLQADLGQCEDKAERAILLELRLVATTTEWIHLPQILANLDEQIKNALRVEAVPHSVKIAQRPDTAQAMAAIKVLLAEYRFVEAETHYAKIRAWVSGFDYRALLHRYQEQYAALLVNQVKDFLTQALFVEADQAHAKIVGLYTQAAYAADRAINWERYQTNLKQNLAKFLTSYQFTEADQLYQHGGIDLASDDYTALRQRHWDAYQRTLRQEMLSTELQTWFNQGKFAIADKYFADHPHLSLDEYAKAKAPYVQAYFAVQHDIELDREQAVAVGMPAHSLLVTARAGSGKTRVLTCKAIYVMTQESLAPKDILLLAFNDDAAKTLGNRMREILRLPKFDTASTFHALAHALIEPGDRLLGDDVGQKSPRRIIQDAITQQWTEPLFATLVNKFFEQELCEQQTWSTDLKAEKLYETKRDLMDFSLRGEEVKSAGEKYIADFLYEYNIPHQYEYAHDWDGSPYRPDFTLFEGNQPKAVIEHWAIDENNLRATTPNTWSRSAAAYRTEMAAKRDYWQQRHIPLVETSVADLRAGRKNFEQTLKQRLEAIGIVCKPSNPQKLSAKLLVEKRDQLTELFLEFIRKAKKQNLTPDAFDFADFFESEPSRSEVFWHLAQLVYQAYEDEKGEHGYLDFEDLMTQAIARIHQESGKCTIVLNQTRVCLHELRWVLVDEFQDLSEPFYHLLDALRHYNPNLKIFGVGDDWQAINGFAGADLTYFRQFEQLFVNPQQTHILTNYRSLPKIIENANAFMAGKGEAARPEHSKAGGGLWINKIDTEMTFQPSNSSVNDQPFLFGDKPSTRNSLAERTLKRCYQIIMHESNRGKEVVILSRSNKIYGIDGKEFAKRITALAERKVTVSTIHKFKGQESEVVILVEVVRGVFPVRHKNNQLWSIFIRDGESVEARAEAEEERLFYVALTRAREKLWILTEEARPSKFLMRLPA